MSARVDMMRAVMQDRYGPPTEVLQMAEIAVPEPGPDEVRISVHAASVNPADWHLVRGEPLVARLVFGLRGPKKVVPGADVAGVIDAVGAAVTDLAVGDEVYGDVGDVRMGTFADAVVAPAALIAPKPAPLSMVEAAAIPLAGITALQAIQRGGVGQGTRVLVVGASGGVGHFAVQIAAAAGATVTAVCSGRNAEFVRSLGAERVIDYTTESYLEGGEYDLVIQLSGTAPAMAFRPVLAARGHVQMLTGDGESRWLGPVGRSVGGLVRSPFVGQRFSMFSATANGPDLRRMTELIEAGRVRPSIEQTCSLADAPAAIARIEQAHTRGKVVVDVV